jgi:hypothetical protein
MARTVVTEESDDDFPDIAELCRRPNLGMSVNEDAVWKAKTGSSSKGESNTQKNLRTGKENSGIKRGMVKKRVLNQISDNPLLQPISKASSELVGETKKDRRSLTARKGKGVRDEFKEIRAKDGPDPDQEELEESDAPPRKTVGSRSREPRKVASKSQSAPATIFESDEEDFGEESDGLSDFIVNDSASLEEGDSVVEMPPPRSVRRLVKGRRPDRHGEDEEDLDLRMKKLTVDDETVKKSRKVSIEKHLEDFEDSYSGSKTLPRTKLPKKTQTKTSQSRKEPAAEQKAQAMAPSSDIEDPFTLRL